MLLIAGELQHGKDVSGYAFLVSADGGCGSGCDIERRVISV
jgi:hypothetical protein